MMRKIEFPESSRHDRLTPVLLASVILLLGIIIGMLVTREQRMVFEFRSQKKETTQ